MHVLCYQNITKIAHCSKIFVTAIESKCSNLENRTISNPSGIVIFQGRQLLNADYICNYNMNSLSMVWPDIEFLGKFMNKKQNCEKNNRTYMNTIQNKKNKFIV